MKCCELRVSTMKLPWYRRTLLKVGYLLGVMLAGVFLFSCVSQPLPAEQLFWGYGNTLVQKSTGNCSEATLSGSLRNAAATALSPRAISILDWNIYKGSRDGWEEDFLRLSVGKDLVFLQEASLDPKFQKALGKGKLFWQLNNAFYYKGKATGVLLASTVSPLASCGQRIREPLIGLPKTVLLGRYGIEGTAKELLVANIHAINITLGTGSYREQFGQLEAILGKHHGPLLVVGDFNNWSDARSTVVDAFASRLNLLKIDFKDEGRARFFGDPVDQVYYRGLIPVRRAVYPVESSDHNPISVTFRLANSVVE